MQYLDKCGNKGAPVATFVANAFITLDNAALKYKEMYSIVKTI
jgi:hypothetical protein